MEIKKTIKLIISGRIDATTASILEEDLKTVTSECKNIILDLSGVDYISSAGLRIILSLYKALKDIGSLKIINAKDDIKALFNISGFNTVFES